MQTPTGYRDDGDVDRDGTRRLTPLPPFEAAKERDWSPPLASDGRVLQAPDAPLFGSKTPLKAGTLRGAVFATMGLVITMALVVLQSQTGILPNWWPAVLTPLLIQILRVWEAYIDQVASG